jgi:hypothetical protein
MTPGSPSTLTSRQVAALDSIAASPRPKITTISSAQNRQLRHFPHPRAQRANCAKHSPENRAKDIDTYAKTGLSHTQNSRIFSFHQPNRTLSRQAAA